MASTAANNYHIGRSNLAKRAEIPFTILTSATIASIVATIDDEFTDSAEIFIAGTTGLGQDGVLGGTAAAYASVLDPSANNASSKAFPALLSADTAPISLGFIVLDGSVDTAPATIPLPGGQNQSPAYGTAQAIGTAQKLFFAEIVITDGSITSLVPGLIGTSLRANVLSAGVTPNGNLKVLVTFPVVELTATTPAAIAPTIKVAGQTVKGFLKLTWL